MHLYDTFFVDGPAIEVVQNLVPCLQSNASDGADTKAIRSNTERLGQATNFMQSL